jgi:hypothetical protein
MTYLNMATEDYYSDTDSEEDRLANELKELMSKCVLNNIDDTVIPESFTQALYHVLFVVGIYTSTAFVCQNWFTILKLFYILFLMTGSIGISMLIVSHSLSPNKKNDVIAEDEKEEEYTVYTNFLNNDYESYAKYLNDDSYVMKDNEELEKLKDKNNHMEMTLPFQQKNTVKFYYDHSDEKFHYYTKSSLDYKVLNSLCRSYVLKNKCTNVFVDEDELEYISSIVEEVISHNSDTNKEDETHSYEELSDDDEEEDKQEEEESNIFYKKKSKKDSIKKELVEKKQNIFIHDGNLSDYETKFNKTVKSNDKSVDYNKYKELFNVAGLLQT